ncbi:DapH/DapD/GlmU-related protein [Agromyces sp. MMS24-JH15]|uniref:DapH/DapD/GlmU-related protein n=1 Tax=Agromyces sp. MMS24-JH15 TaxID=3243765 RepID=UPI003747BB2C
MNRIHPTAVISGDVRIGARTTIGAFAVVTGPVEIGDDNWIGAGAIIGAPPEVRSFAHPLTADDPAGNGVRIGHRNVIREAVQIHQGWKGTTTIGDDAFIMNQTYIAHDGVLGDGVTLASSVLLAGHVRIGDRANLGLGASVHQFREVGAGAMVGMASVVTRDLPPFAKAYGSPAVVRAANVVGMERSGVASEIVDVLEALYSGSDVALDALDTDPAIRAQVERWVRARDETRTASGLA